MPALILLPILSIAVPSLCFIIHNSEYKSNKQ